MLVRGTRRSALKLARLPAVRARACVRLNSTQAAASVDPKIEKIVQDISKLTLLETSALISELKTQLNIPDIAMPVAGAAPAGAAAPAAEEAKEEEVKEEKTIFAIKLESFDAKSKPKVIKEVKNLLGLSLVEAKKFVEAAPKILKDNVAKEDADKIKASLEALGAKVALE
ncbi:mitochondrial 54S ribosomal protein bL12m [Lachancea thermotolerans CBS 6340]|uniref:KLTH0H04202p n=1 Tax=Lachancea thermotolerans (strain ATCC 56472 / CBS 6340 / NRRL Y-8284) TaxID=559295 RepID=C5E2E2_LACTC|nr:putative mitochondrial 54S ribosomal protein MNP1 [Lachancea thermotolerans CBS 6340]CAR30203.1 KLTH0H04202p [Lachancea thermotolerans CBS 6340]